MARRLIQIKRLRPARCLIGLMINPIAAWHADHARFARLLDDLEAEVLRFHEGGSPDYERMRDIVLWLRHYADGVHHPREDVAFERMARRDASLGPQVNRLRQEHRVIGNAGEALLAGLDAAANDGFAPRAELESAAATFLVYYRNHLNSEETNILPRAAGLLGEEDWAAVAAVVPPESGRAAAALHAARTLGLI